MSKAKRAPRLDHAVYIGRERLGRYMQRGRDRYQAFDAAGRSLGFHRSRVKALGAIDKAKVTRS
jgi:hypothetical protein